MLSIDENILIDPIQADGSVLSIDENILIDPTGVPKECLPYIQVSLFIQDT